MDRFTAATRVSLSSSASVATACPVTDCATDSLCPHLAPDFRSSLTVCAMDDPFEFAPSSSSPKVSFLQTLKPRGQSCPVSRPSVGLMS